MQTSAPREIPPTSCERLKRHRRLLSIVLKNLHVAPAFICFAVPFGQPFGKSTEILDDVSHARRTPLMLTITRSRFPRLNPSDAPPCLTMAGATPATDNPPALLPTRHRASSNNTLPRHPSSQRVLAQPARRHRAAARPSGVRIFARRTSPTATIPSFRRRRRRHQRRHRCARGANTEAPCSPRRPERRGRAAPLAAVPSPSHPAALNVPAASLTPLAIVTASPSASIPLRRQSRRPARASRSFACRGRSR